VRRGDTPVGRSARLVNLLRVQHAQQEEKESYKEQSAYDPIKKENHPGG